MPIERRTNRMETKPNCRFKRRKDSMKSKRMRHWILNTIQKLKNMRSLELLSQVEAKYKQGRPQNSTIDKKRPSCAHVYLEDLEAGADNAARARLGREKENKRSKADRNVAICSHQ